MLKGLITKEDLNLIIIMDKVVILRQKAWLYMFQKKVIITIALTPIKNLTIMQIMGFLIRVISINKINNKIKRNTISKSKKNQKNSIREETAEINE